MVTIGLCVGLTVTVGLLVAIGLGLDGGLGVGLGLDGGPLVGLFTGTVGLLVGLLVGLGFEGGLAGLDVEVGPWLPDPVTKLLVSEASWSSLSPTPEPASRQGCLTAQGWLHTLTKLSKSVPGGQLKWNTSKRNNLRKHPMTLLICNPS